VLPFGVSSPAAELADEEALARTAGGGDALPRAPSAFVASGRLSEHEGLGTWVGKAALEYADTSTR
jgi:hypothetical protein